MPQTQSGLSRSSWSHWEAERLCGRVLGNFWALLILSLRVIIQWFLSFLSLSRNRDHSSVWLPSPYKGPYSTKKRLLLLRFPQCFHMFRIPASSECYCMVIDNCLRKGDLGPLTYSDLRGLEDRQLGSEGNSNGQSHKKSSLHILTVSAALGQPR